MLVVAVNYLLQLVQGQQVLVCAGAGGSEQRMQDHGVVTVAVHHHAK